MADTATRQMTDARFLEVLRTVADQVVDQTGTSVNGEVWNAYRPYPEDAPDGYIPGYIPPDVWIAEQVEAALTQPATNAETVSAMLAARARLGENIRLIEDINLYRVRDNLRRLIRDQGRVGAELRPADELDEFEALLDFVAEIRQIAKDI
jgi:hypothetical protein